MQYIENQEQMMTETQNQIIQVDHSIIYMPSTQSDSALTYFLFFYPLIFIFFEKK
jgi:hypothetical protein